ncbi:hypothetical protein WR25_03610 [Diploscapter pachys]|uniref:Mitochondrial 2-oxodicarboxylate carrier n=1 Tax=Diploscapter pachys TaxID=2018661 RepID=A0A2A2KCA0_9BILA|nr:hypothetical protein WR25_03610 [Diploscapter pachys]
MNRVKEGACQIAAGGTAGFVEVCLMQPLDVVKTRLQIVSTNGGFATCVRTTYLNEGLLGFYKGLIPPILADTPKRASKFFMFEQFRSVFTNPDIPPVLTYSLAGMFSGLTSALLVCPFEVIKITQQSERHVNFFEQRSCKIMARDIIKSEGGKGIYRGLPTLLTRNGVWNMVYFGFYFTAKDYIPPSNEGHSKNIAARIFLGFVAGSLASATNVPLDVCQIRIMGPQPVKGQRKYKSTFQTLNLVYKEEGLAALYRGLLPKCMRLGPGGAVMLVVYESVYNSLKTLI